jgi:hypothetical protein
LEVELEDLELDEESSPLLLLPELDELLLCELDFDFSWRRPNLAVWSSNI